MPQKALRELLLLVQYAMAQQDIRYYLNGLLLLLDGGQIKVIATDGHRLSYAARPLGQRFVVLASGDLSHRLAPGAPSLT